jgi:large subunit ribosomal protein L10
VERAQKEKLVTSLQHALADTVCLVVTHQTGLTVAEATDLRRQMRAAGASFKVTKNRLARRAIAGTKFEPISSMFTGPTAIAYSRDPVAAAKIVVEYSNRNKKLSIVGGSLGDRQLDEAGVKSLATLPSLDQLRAKLIGVLQSPAAKVAAVLQAPGSQLARVLDAYATKAGQAA